jgi:hypothetical protein
MSRFGHDAAFAQREISARHCASVQDLPGTITVSSPEAELASDPSAGIVSASDVVESEGSGEGVGIGVSLVGSGSGTGCREGAGTIAGAVTAGSSMSVGCGLPQAPLEAATTVMVIPSAPVIAQTAVTREIFMVRSFKSLNADTNIPALSEMAISCR